MGTRVSLPLGAVVGGWVVLSVRLPNPPNLPKAGLKHPPASRPAAAQDWDDMLAAVICRLRTLTLQAAHRQQPDGLDAAMACAVGECTEALGQLQQAFNPSWASSPWVAARVAADLARMRARLLHALAEQAPARTNNGGPRPQTLQTQLAAALDQRRATGHVLRIPAHRPEAWQSADCA